MQKRLAANNFNKTQVESQKTIEEDFDEMIRRKYNIDHDLFLKMDYKERN